tara:strand:+ start:1401 stop:1862 length:462 start_codon:yes stop_codon:yes gene_type:complete
MSVELINVTHLTDAPRAHRYVNPANGDRTIWQPGEVQEVDEDSALEIIRQHGPAGVQGSKKMAYATEENRRLGAEYNRMLGEKDAETRAAGEDLTELTVNELKARLDAANVKPERGARKADLIALLEAQPETKPTTTTAATSRQPHRLDSGGR